MPKPHHFSHSFTALGLEFENMKKFVRYMNENDQDIPPMDHLGIKRQATYKRKIQEYLKRAACMTEAQKDLFVHGSRSDSLAILWISIVKTYELIELFFDEEVIPSYQTSLKTLPPYAFRDFYERLLNSHPDMRAPSEATRKKAESRILKFLLDVGILQDKSERKLFRPYLSPDALHVLEEEDPSQVRFLLHNTTVDYE